MRRFLAVSLLAAALIATNVPPGGAAVTLGQIGPPAVGQCEGFDTVQATLTTGNSYTVPGDGTITQWSTYGGPNPGTMSLKVFRLIASPATYLAVGHAGPQSVTPNGTAGNTFPANIQVKAGDLVGVNAAGAWCILSSDGGQQLNDMGDLADGASAPFANPTMRSLNVQAIFVPDNSFRITNTTLNKKKGTATLTVNVPNPGELTGSGDRANVAGAPGAVISKAVSPGNAQLLIKAEGKKKRMLKEKGKVNLTVAVAYTPTGGDASTQSVNVKLKKKLKKR